MTAPQRIKLLGSSAYLSFLEHVPDGQSACTHVASVEVGGEEKQMYAKYYQPSTRELVNEVTGYLLAQAVNLPQPPTACIVKAPTKELRRHFPAKTFPDRDHVPIWCVEKIPGNTPKQLYQCWNDPTFRADLARWRQLPGCAAFDDWTANTDRNTGNLVRTGRGQYWLIDHGILATSKAWTGENLDPAGEFLNKLVAIAWDDAPKLPAKNAMYRASEHHSAGYQTAEAELNFWWNLLLIEHEQQQLAEFLWRRAVSGPLRIAKRYLVI